MRAATRKLIVVAAVAAAMVATPTVALAQSEGGQDFGRHVSTCARTMGFDGTNNPGMHRGFAGWDPMHEC
jgi:Ni/Co efflux regulator RcnB